MPRMVGLLVSLAALVVVAPASATSVNVTTPNDVVSTGDGLCSLREAVKATSLNSSSGAAAGECPAGNSVLDDAITVPAGTYQLTIAGAKEDASATGDLDVLQSVTITGAGSATTIVDGGDLDRVLQITAGTVSISGFTFRNGQTPNGNDSFGNGGDGGGIHNAGTLALTDVAVTDNRTGTGRSAGDSGDPSGGGGGNGGGILSTGPLTLTGVRVTGNVAGNGGSASGGGRGGSGAGGGSGGGIAALAGSPLTITDGVIDDNHTGTGGNGGFATYGGSGGGGGNGGGMYADGALTISGSKIRNNSTADGGQYGQGRVGYYGDPGPGGAGGGIYHATGALAITDTDIAQNTTGTSANAAGGGTPSPGGAGGGLRLASGSTAVLSGLNVTGNTTGVGGSGDTSGDGNGGTVIRDPRSGGEGGGIAVGGGTTLALRSSTISGNHTGAGGAGDGSGGATGGLGAGVYGGGPLTVTNATITDNTIGASGSGTGAPLAIPGGAGVYTAAGTTTSLRHTTVVGNHLPSDGLGEELGAAGDGMTVTASIIVGSGAISCRVTGGTIADGGHNISFAGSGCPGTDADPQLGPAADNGGRTLTMLPGAGSAALDIVPADGCPALDQRGLTRPQGTLCDAGAVEVFVVPAEPTPEPTTDPGETTPAPEPTTTVTPEPTVTATPTPAPDVTRPSVSFGCNKPPLGRALKRGLRCTLKTSEAGTATVKVKSKCAGRATITAPGKKAITCRFTKRSRRALKGAERVSLRLVLVVEDEAGNAARRTARVVLRS